MVTYSANGSFFARSILRESEGLIRHRGYGVPSHFPKTPGKPYLEAAYISEDSSLVNEFGARGVLNLCYRLGERDSERPGDVAVACSDFQRNRAMPLCSNGVALPD